MAQRILAFIRQESLEQGAPLRELKLAEHFGVSRTPIRNALKLLEEEGVVRIEPNVGTFVALSADDLRGVSLVLPPSEDDQLYLRISEDRLSGRLPERVTQVEIQRLYDLDRLTTERVLGRMAEEGLMVRNTGQGWSFLPTLDSHRARRASYQLRRAIEPAAILVPEFKPDRQALAGLRREHEALLECERRGERISGPELYRIDALFHETIVEFSGNPLFVQAIQQQNRMRRMLEHRGNENRRRVSSWCQEHLGIIAALEHGFVQEASFLLTIHLDRANSAAAEIPASDSDSDSGAAA
ncbi:GntR family transcriptional regulator [Roseospira marina]|nr:GntR family transcriptional regulator [Roseospira marina]MBB4314004.1 DNA-binding GntR family transcriptional regulator [Roseospira marina]MBB5087166.1 DNA-binding GntR family transcriptional regulator [Roseospira marina]